MSDANGARLSLPWVEVVLDDGRTLKVQILNADLLRWDRTAAKHGWPKFTEAAAMHQTFLAWSALRRTGDIPTDMTWDSFADEHCLQVQGIAANGTAPDAPDAELDYADPTQTAVEPG